MNKEIKEDNSTITKSVIDEATMKLIEDYDNNDSPCCGNGCGVDCKG